MENIETIIETRQGTIQIVTYNKPKRKNAIDSTMYLRVTKILQDAATNEEITTLVLTGTGDYYSSGNDLKAIAGKRDSDFINILKNYISAFITFPKLLVAVVNGPAIGVAATTLSFCDLVFASENSFFYTPFTKLGIVAEGCSTLMFPRLIGERKAVEMLLYNHKMSAEEALQCGFVNYIYSPEEIQNKVWDRIQEVSELSQSSILASKRLLRRTMQEELLQRNELEMEELNKLWHSKESNQVQPLVTGKSKI